MKLYYAYIDGSIEIELSRECIEHCAHSGECDDDVENWLQDEDIRKQFNRIKKDVLKAHIREWGSHTDGELNRMTKHELSMYVLWDSCFTILDSEEF